MDYKEVEALIGKTLQDESVKAFLEKVGIKYPKKDTISGRAVEWHFWLIGKKAGLELLFSIDVKNLKYKVEQAERKGVFKPILTVVRFTEKTPFTLPFEVTYASTLDELKKKLGEPTGSYDIAFPASIWESALDENKESVFYLLYRIDKEKVCDIRVGLKGFKELFRLYYTQYGDTIESVLKKTYVYDEEEKKTKRPSIVSGKASDAVNIKGRLFFIMWAADNGYLYLGEEFKEDVEKLRERKVGVEEFALKAFKGNPYVTLDNFVNVDKDFVYVYINNSDPYYLYFMRDFESAFSKKKDELKIAADISKLEYSEENRRIVSEMVNKRYEEFKKLQEGK